MALVLVLVSSTGVAAVVDPNENEDGAVAGVIELVISVVLLAEPNENPVGVAVEVESVLVVPNENPDLTGVTSDVVVKVAAAFIPLGVAVSEIEVDLGVPKENPANGFVDGVVKDDSVLGVPNVNPPEDGIIALLVILDVSNEAAFSFKLVSVELLSTPAGFAAVPNEKEDVTGFADSVIAEVVVDVVVMVEFEVFTALLPNPNLIEGAAVGLDS